MANPRRRGIMAKLRIEGLWPYLEKKDYDLTKNLITATTLLFVTRPTRFWQAPHSAQGTTKPGKTWSGEPFLFNQQEIQVANIFSTFRRELEILTQKRREVQGRQVDINRDNRKSLENAIDMQLQLLQVLTKSGTLTWTCDVGKSVIFLRVSTNTAAFIYIHSL